MHIPARQLATFGLAVAIACGGLSVAPKVAVADENDAALSAEVERCTTAYNEAQGKVDELLGQIAENEARVAEIEAELPVQKRRTADSIRSLYRFQQTGGGLLDLVLSAEDFNEFVSTLRYLDIIQSHDLEEINRLVQLQDELSIIRASLDAQRLEAESERDAAQQALADAEAAREAARQAAVARAAAEALQRQAALEESSAHAGEAFTTASGNTATVMVPASGDTTNGNTSQEQQSGNAHAGDAPDGSGASSDPGATAPLTNPRDEFISVWAARIDAFNAGYPLAGYGYAFATAAYDCGVDPRWSPAIARMESSSGLYCFASHNAWGWGDVDWPDWETAIYSHVAGLGSGYGYTLTWGAAQTYCPPNASHWYSSVSSCMQQIWSTDSL